MATSFRNWLHAYCGYYGVHWTAALWRRWPRLLRAMQVQANLSRSEAAAGLRAYIEGRDGSGSPYGPEAVEHYGGPATVLADTVRNRHRNREPAGA